MASAKKKPAAKKPAAANRTAKARGGSTTKSAKAPAARATASKSGSGRNAQRTLYTPRVQAMVYIFVVLAILFASLAFYRYP